MSFHELFNYLILIVCPGEAELMVPRKSDFAHPRKIRAIPILEDSCFRAPGRFQGEKDGAHSVSLG